MDYKKLILLIAQDYTDQQIANTLGYSVWYVRDCVSKLIHKYDCRSRTGILLNAIKNNDLQIDNFKNIDRSVQNNQLTPLY